MGYQRAAAPLRLFENSASGAHIRQGRNRSEITGQLKYGLNRTLNSLEITASHYTLDENELKTPPKHSSARCLA